MFSSKMQRTPQWFIFFYTTQALTLRDESSLYIHLTPLDLTAPIKQIFCRTSMKQFVGMMVLVGTCWNNEGEAVKAVSLTEPTFC
jgi:hypothetical protein